MLVLALSAFLGAAVGCGETTSPKPIDLTAEPVTFDGPGAVDTGALIPVRVQSYVTGEAARPHLIDLCLRTAVWATPAVALLSLMIDRLYSGGRGVLWAGVFAAGAIAAVAGGVRFITAADGASAIGGSDRVSPNPATPQLSRDVRCSGS
jgi:hypothetical protein